MPDRFTGYALVFAWVSVLVIGGAIAVADQGPLAAQIQRALRGANLAAGVTPSGDAGVAVGAEAEVRTVGFTATVATTAFVCAGLTCDVTVATLPAGYRLESIVADLTEVFACTAVCTSTTLSMTAGSSAGATDLLLTFDADAAILQRGLADGDLGAGITRAAAIQGGFIGSWSTTTPVSLRLTSGTGNIGNGTVTNLSTGSITFQLLTSRLK